jgi:hypothetical protein
MVDISQSDIEARICHYILENNGDPTQVIITILPTHIQYQNWNYNFPTLTLEQIANYTLTDEQKNNLYKCIKLLQDKRSLNIQENLLIKIIKKLYLQIHNTATDADFEQFINESLLC